LCAEGAPEVPYLASRSHQDVRHGDGAEATRADVISGADQNAKGTAGAGPEGSATRQPTVTTILPMALRSASCRMASPPRASGKLPLITGFKRPASTSAKSSAMSCR